MTCRFTDSETVLQAFVSSCLDHCKYPSGSESFKQLQTHSLCLVINKKRPKCKICPLSWMCDCDINWTLHSFLWPHKQLHTTSLTSSLMKHNIKSVHIPLKAKVIRLKTDRSTVWSEGRWDAEQPSRKQDRIHHSLYCGADNKQTDGVIMILHGESHLGAPIPPWPDYRKEAI